MSVPRHHPPSRQRSSTPVRRHLGFASALALTGLMLCACGPSDAPNADAPADTVTKTVSAPTDATDTAAPDTTATTAAGNDTGTTAEHPATPTRPNRDDANVDARDFENGAGEFFFRSPSGNVWCAIRPDDTHPELQFGCQTRSSVPGSSGVVCRNAADHSYAVRIEGRGTVQFCTNQGIYSTESPRTLEYGQTIMVRGQSCTSTTAGITCYGPASGFIISRDVNQVL